MSYAPNAVRFLFDNSSQLAKALTNGVADTEPERIDVLGSMLGLVGEFKGLDMFAVMTQVGATLNKVATGESVPSLAGLTMTEPLAGAGMGVGGGKDGDGVAAITSAPPTYTDETGKVRYPTAEEVTEHKARVAAGAPTSSTGKQEIPSPIKLMKATSMLLIDEEALNAEMSRIGTTHGIITIAISVLSVIAEIASLGQLDRLLDAIQSIYTLLDEPAAFYKTRDSRIEVVYDRPYRYWLERELQNAMPPPTDLTRFLAREVISEDEYNESMTYWGFSAYYSELYRHARYIELPAQTIYELLHRDIIDDAEAARLLKIADYNPTQIPNLVELSYDYPNRTELRVMARRTNIPDELVKRALQTSGLRPEYQEYLIEMLENWYVAGIQTRSITEATRQYEDGLLSDEIFVEICLDNRASEAETYQYAKSAKLRRDGRRKLDRTNTIRRAYRSALLSDTVEYLDIVKKHFPDIEESAITEIEIYQSLMFDLGYDEVDTEIMLDDDKIRSKDVTAIESLTELLDSVSKE